MRLFVALNLSSELRVRIAADVLTPLRTQLSGVRWVQPETLHVTLLFLGERSHAEAEKIKPVLQEVVALQEPFTATLSGLGVLPSPARARVVWLGLENATPVITLHRVLVCEHDRLSTLPEGRVYRPHVTLGRIPPAAEVMGKGLTQALARVRFTAPVGFSSVELMRSELTPRGPRYTVLFTALLGLP